MSQPVDKKRKTPPVSPKPRLNGTETGLTVCDKAPPRLMLLTATEDGAPRVCCCPLDDPTASVVQNVFILAKQMDDRNGDEYPTTVVRVGSMIEALIEDGDTSFYDDADKTLLKDLHLDELTSADFKAWTKSKTLWGLQTPSALGERFEVIMYPSRC